MTQRNGSAENLFAYLDLAIGEEKVGRVVIELFRNIVPKTVENFRALCTGEKGLGTLSKPLHFKNSKIHRAVPQFMIQGGDIINNNGSGGESIYGLQFPDENFMLHHEDEGMVSMANAGPNTNSSQFFITTVPCTHLDGVNVVFGKVRKGLGVVQEISQVKTENDRPLVDCRIVKCGELKPGDKWGIEDCDVTDDIYPPWPEDWDHSQKVNANELETVITKIKNSGNFFFSNKNYVESDRKYRKALRYINYSTKLKYVGPSVNKNKLNEIRILSLLNLAAVKLKRKLYKDALGYCNEVLILKPKCGKAYYRRGQAYAGLNEHQKALDDLKIALVHVPNDRMIMSEIKTVQSTIDKYLQKEKQVFSKMFQKRLT